MYLRYLSFRCDKIRSQSQSQSISDTSSSSIQLLEMKRDDEHIVVAGYHEKLARSATSDRNKKKSTLTSWKNRYFVLKGYLCSLHAIILENYRHILLQECICITTHLKIVNNSKDSSVSITVMYVLSHQTRLMSSPLNQVITHIVSRSQKVSDICVGEIYFITSEAPCVYNHKFLRHFRRVFSLFINLVKSFNV